MSCVDLWLCDPAKTFEIMLPCYLKKVTKLLEKTPLHILCANPFTPVFTLTSLFHSALCALLKYSTPEILYFAEELQNIPVNRGCDEKKESIALSEPFCSFVFLPCYIIFYHFVLCYNESYNQKYVLYYMRC